MVDYTTLTISKDALDDFYETKEVLYGDLADQVTNQRTLEDLMALAESDDSSIEVHVEAEDDDE